MLEINSEKETQRIVEFIQDTFKEKGFTKAVIGISGGLDSAVVAKLLIKALGKENVLGYYLPYGLNIEDSYTFSRKIQIKLKMIGLIINDMSITFIVDELVSAFDKIRKGNIIARVRMIILYDKSACHNALVVGTSNKSELMLGYFTIYGDGACALNPIGHLYKTEVFHLARYLGVPKEIIEKPPSAGLWAGQTDEEELGMSYKEIDFILGCIEGGRIKNGQGTPTQLEVKKIIDMVNKNKFKLELPKIIK